MEGSGGEHRAFTIRSTLFRKRKTGRGQASPLSLVQNHKTDGNVNLMIPETFLHLFQYAILDRLEFSRLALTENCTEIPDFSKPCIRIRGVGSSNTRGFSAAI